MPTLTMTVTGIRPMPNAKPNAPVLVTGDNGLDYKIWRNSSKGGPSAALLQVGGTYEITHEAEEYNEGGHRKSPMITRIGVLGEPSKGNGGMKAAPGKPGAIGGEKDRLISALALLKPMLESGKIPSHEEAKEMCDRALSMYEYMRVSYNPQHADDMDDEVKI